MTGWHAALAGLILAAAFLLGRVDGEAIVRGRQVAIDAAVAKVRIERESKVDAIGAGAAARETTRQEQVREIIRESHTVTERPVYRNVCVDADGVRLLDRAAAAANGEDPGIGAAGAGQGAGGASQP